MSKIGLLLDLVSNLLPPKRFLIGRIIGCFLLTIAVVLGLFFLFQALIPIVGYLQSGAIFCGIFLIVGLSFVFFNQEKKKPNPLEDVLKAVQEVYKNIDIDFELVKQKVPQILLISCIAGLTLYQIKVLLCEFKKRK